MLFCFFAWVIFYELFYEDAVNAAQILEISLTSRNKNAENPIPMAGVPYHSAQQYIDVLVERGYKVPSLNRWKTLNRLWVSLSVRSFRSLHQERLLIVVSQIAKNNFLVAIDRDGSQYGLAYMDLVTGDFYVTGLSDFSLVCGEIRNLKAREVVIGYDLSEAEEKILSRQMNLVLSYEQETYEDVHLLDSRLATV